MNVSNRPLFIGLILGQYALAGRISEIEEVPCEPKLALDRSPETPSTFHDVFQALQAYDKAFAAINMTYKVSEYPTLRVLP